jgi:hypothetical protein
MSAGDGHPPKVFISYSHDDAAHEAFVLGFANQLRADSVESWIDKYFAGAGSWMQWMQQQMAEADFVLMICTETYRRRAEGEEQPGRGRGVAFEAALIMGYLYEASMQNHRFLPVVRDGAADTVVPRAWRFDRRFSLDSQYRALLRTLRGEAEVAVPPVAPRQQPPSARDAPPSPADAPAASPVRSTEPEPIHLYVADVGFVPDSPLAVVACLYTDRPAAITRAFTEIREQVARDPALGTLPAARAFVDGRSLAADDPEVRARVYQRLGAMTAQIFVCCRPLAAGEDPALVFHQLLGRLLFDRVRAYRTRPIDVTVDGLGVVKSADDVRAVIGSCAVAVRARHDLPATPEVTVRLAAGDPAAAAAAYAGQAVKARIEAPASIEGRAFEHLRRKVRVIHRLDTGVFYDRRNQLP